MAFPTNRWQKPFVQMKRRWSDRWQTELELEVDSWDHAVAPARPQARLSYMYGTVSDGTGPYVDMKTLLEARDGWFVRIMRQATLDEWAASGTGPDPQPVQLFVGVLVRAKDARGAPWAAGEMGDEAGRVLGLEWLLENVQISTSIFWDGAAAVVLKTSLPFNIRDGRTKTIQGNRSAAKHAGPGGVQESYLFSDTDGAVWTAADIIEYLVFRFAPPFMLTQVSPAYLDNLRQFTDAWKPFRNIRQGLNALSHRTRGHSWRLEVTSYDIHKPDGGTDFAVIRIAPTFKDRVEGGGISLAPNHDLVNLDESDERVTGTINISDDAQPQFDRIEVIGDPVIIMDTLDWSAGPPAEIVRNWTDTLEAAYKVADDKGRTASMFEAVYRSFKVTTSLLTAGPTVNDDGSLDGDTAPPQSYLGKTLLRQLPMLKSADDVEAGVDEGPKEFRRPLLVAWVPDASAYVPLDKIKGTADGLGTVSVRMSAGEMGFTLTGGINHTLALNHWVSGAGTVRPKVEPKIDYEAIEATVAWASSERLRVIVDFKRDNAAGAPRTKVIYVPGAQAWWRAPNVTTDIEAGARVIETDYAELRNDRADLQAVAVLAKSWFEVERRTCSVQFAGLVDDYEVGQILQFVEGPFGSTPINTLISRVTYNAVKGLTIVQTAFSELDFARVTSRTGGGTIRTPGLSFPDKPAIGAAFVGQEPDNLPALTPWNDHQVIVERGMPTAAFTGGATIILNPVDKDGEDIPGKEDVTCHLTPDKSSVNAIYGLTDVLAFCRYEGDDGAADGLVIGVPRPLISGTGVQYVTISPDGTHKKLIRLAFDNTGVMIGKWDNAGLNWVGRDDLSGTPIPEPTAPTYTITAL